MSFLAYSGRRVLSMNLSLMAFILSLAGCNSPRNFEAVIQNQSGSTVLVEFKHVWTNGNVPQVLPAISLPVGFTLSWQGLSTGSGGSDEWSLALISNKTCFYRINKQCNVTDDDISTGKPVRINLLNPQQGFTIELPSSSSCTDNFLRHQAPPCPSL